MMYTFIILLVAIAFIFADVSAFRNCAQKSSFISLKGNSVAEVRKLFGKIAKAVDEDSSRQLQETIPPDGDDDLISLPYSGLAGYEPNNLFYKPVDVYDPLKDTSDLPGEVGSDERIAAIQQRIQQRVEALQRSGEWDSNQDSFGQDPLKNQSIFKTMQMQVAACRPFESVSDLGLTYTLVVSTTLMLMLYLVLLRESLDTSMKWFLDFDFS